MVLLFPRLTLEKNDLNLFENAALLLPSPRLGGSSSATFAIRHRTLEFRRPQIEEAPPSSPARGTHTLDGSNSRPSFICKVHSQGRENMPTVDKQDFEFSGARPPYRISPRLLAGFSNPPNPRVLGATCLQGSRRRRLCFRHKEIKWEKI